MLISGKGRYAITAMMNLAMHNSKGPLSLADISQTQGISLSYLEQIFSRLRKKGLVQGTRGRRGGYRLGRSANAITMADIIRAVEDGTDQDELHNSYLTTSHHSPPTQKYWENLNTQLFDFLGHIKLADSVTQPGIMSAAVAQQEAPPVVRPSPH